MGDAVRSARRRGARVLPCSGPQRSTNPATGLTGLPRFQPQPLLEARLAALALRELGFLRQTGAGSVAASPPDLAGFLRSIALKALRPGPLCRNEPVLEKASDQLASFGDFHLNPSRRDHVHDRGS